MKTNTSELIGTALDWAVAKAEGGADFGTDGITHSFKLHGRTKVLATGWALSMSYHPSTDWAQGGPIIEREGIQWNKYDDVFYAWIGGTHHDPLNVPMVETELTCTDAFEYGPTILVAAVRCYVASKLGDEVDVPAELLEVQP